MVINWVNNYPRPMPEDPDPKDIPPEFRGKKTVPFDPRFPNTNQTKNCYVNFLDFHRCAKLHGADYDACRYFKQAYLSLCPNDWHTKWDEQIEKGIFPGNI
ncbi:cytochrome c oxidase subunit 6B1-like isoform X2 [Chelonus insularis]|uniref:cytochrome c oxidase subunit 6B1-like isoform X2 n=1 Tax=Chelonus insularis TaxID=460826 RepID=UPI00158B7C7B|nr:cytochrome c oxidase subunit 6B1-like isoform X2 [Chelonus insularis]